MQIIVHFLLPLFYNRKYTWFVTFTTFATVLYFSRPHSMCPDTVWYTTCYICRYVTFSNSLLKSKKMPVRFLARLAQSDLRTVLGKTLSSLLNSCGLAPHQSSQLTANLVKRKLSYFATPDSEAWRVDMSLELLKLRQSELELPGFSSAEREEILKHICVSWWWALWWFFSPGLQFFSRTAKHIVP